MAALNSGLASFLPLMTRLIHVLLTLSFRAIAIFAPRGLPSKNSVSVIGTPIGLTASYTLKKYFARGLYLQVKFDTIALL
jgi:hypothetical protein